MTQSVTTYLPDEVYKKLEEAKEHYERARAYPEKLSMSAYVRILILEGLSLEEKRVKKQKEREQSHEGHES